MWPKDRTATLKLFNISIVTTVERILFQHTTAAGKKNTCHNWLLCVFDAGRGGSCVVAGCSKYKRNGIATNP